MSIEVGGRREGRDNELMSIGGKTGGAGGGGGGVRERWPSSKGRRNQNEN